MSCLILVSVTCLILARHKYSVGISSISGHSISVTLVTEIHFFFLRFILFPGKIELQRGRLIEIFHLCIHSPNGCSGQIWARPKWEALSWSPLWVQGPKHLGCPSTAFLCALAELHWKWSSSDWSNHIGCWLQFIANLLCCKSGLRDPLS